MAITASTRSFGIFEAPKGFDLIAKSFEAKLEPLHRLIEKQSQDFAHLIAVLDTPSNRLELHIYRKALRGQSPELSRIIKQLLSRFAFVLIALQEILNLFSDRRFQKKLSKYLFLIGLTPCAPNLPLR